ncbi:MAG: aminotransferase class I/II-fold pyridoxal phosphate-dependent enzyme [bacterium]|nr:aminotransferase class I/II-fold pyridoxal phosphate-dependent enzyme [bacterium]
MKFIPYGRQSLEAEDLKSVVEVLESDYLTTGPKVKEFESALCGTFGCREAIVVSSGTAALHLAANVLLESGDKVLTTPNSFVATANSILYSRAKPVFVDIRPDGNLDLDKCEELLAEDSSIKAIFGVNFSGLPLCREKLKSLKKKYNIKILEDACHSPGADQVGNGEVSDCTILSFHPVKHITTGEGGAVLTNDSIIADKIRRLRTGGIQHDSDAFTTDWSCDQEGNPHPWAYEMHDLGYNYRLTDLQCALGMTQLPKLTKFIELRQQIASKYDKAFGHSDSLRPLYEFTSKSVYHLYVLRADFSKLKVSRTEFFKRMRDRGIGLQLHYIPIPYQPYYQKLELEKTDIPEMDRYFDQSFSIPIFPKMSNYEVKKVINSIQCELG